MSFTQTFFFRKSSFDIAAGDIKRDSDNAPMGDIQIIFHLALHGNVKYIPKHMSTYRRHNGSVTHTPRGDNVSFLSRCEEFTIRMIMNSGHTDWAEERIKKQKGTSEFNTPGKMGLLKVSRFLLGKCHYTLFKLWGRIKFMRHMATCHK